MMMVLHLKRSKVARAIEKACREEADQTNISHVPALRHRAAGIAEEAEKQHPEASLKNIKHLWLK